MRGTIIWKGNKGKYVKNTNKTIHVTQAGHGAWYATTYHGKKLGHHYVFYKKSDAVKFADNYSRKHKALRYGNEAYGEYGTRQGTVARRVVKRKPKDPWGLNSSNVWGI